MSIVAAVNYRAIQDVNLTATTALPAANASVTPTSFDTGDNTDGIFPEHVAMEVVVPATPALVSAAVITFTLLADTVVVPTTVLSPSLTYTITGTAGNGAAATFRWKIPANAGRYLAVKASCDANTGSNIAVSYTSRLVF